MRLRTCPKKSRMLAEMYPLLIAWGYFSDGIMAAILLITYLFSTPSAEDSLNDTTDSHSSTSLGKQLRQQV